METEEPSATKVAPKFDKTSIMTGDKFDDRKLARVKLPTREQRQFYASEKLEDCLSLRVVIGFGGIRPHLEACENSLISDLPGTHFDGRPINRERPFLVGLGRVIRRPTNDSNWIESRTWTRCSSPSPTDDHFFECYRAPEDSDPSSARRKPRHFSVPGPSPRTSSPPSSRCDARWRRR